MHALAILALALPLAPSVPRGGGWDGERFVVHEWGTFTTVLAADGVVLEGLTHEDGDLPAFVHELGGGLTGLSPKMETPVVYAYAPEQLVLEVDVRFPRGHVTHWYPAAGRVDAPAGTPLASGRIRWGSSGELTLLAPRPGGEGGTAGPLELDVGADEPLRPLEVAGDAPWRFARDVGANGMLVRREPWALAGTDEPRLELEPFLFYRGLGDFPLPLRARVLHDDAAHAGGHCVVRLALENERPAEPLRQLVLVCVDGDRAGFRALPDLATPLDLGAVELELRPIEEASRALVRHLTERLFEAGLYADEALAMALTWRHAWMGDEGLRLLYVVPRELVDRELPLVARTPPATFLPEGEEARLPDELTRVFVARTELLSPSAERRHAERVLALEGSSPEDAAAELERAWGRFALPYLDGVRRRAREEAVRERAGELRSLLLRPPTR